MKKVNVIVEWQGDKATHLPSSLKYSAVAMFPEDVNWLNEAWSIVLEFAIPPNNQGNPSSGSAHFLVDDAPQERFIKGKIFELYEGKKLTAKVTIE